MRISDWSSDVCSSDLPHRTRVPGVIRNPYNGGPSPYRGSSLAKPNYSFEKRQREIAKKKKQDLKDARKREARERSEANTSGLQSLMRISYAVFCLKKTTSESYQKLIQMLHHRSHDLTYKLTSIICPSHVDLNTKKKQST